LFFQYKIEKKQESEEEDEDDDDMMVSRKKIDEPADPIAREFTYL
jgi:hypothetical protein